MVGDARSMGGGLSKPLITYENRESGFEPGMIVKQGGKASFAYGTGRLRAACPFRCCTGLVVASSSECGAAMCAAMPLTAVASLGGEPSPPEARTH